MPAQLPDGRPLVGPVVRLDATTEQDAAALFAALDDPVVWASGYGGGPAGRPTAAAWWAQAIPDPAERRQFTVRLTAPLAGLPAGTVVGTTSLGDFSPVDERVHLGWTAYAPAVWASAVNPACKLLVLGHAFDDLGFGRVKIQCDDRNTRSAAAIARLGAVREGVLRRHLRRADGSFRDTVVFSVLREEWPAVAAGLRTRLVG